MLHSQQRVEEGKIFMPKILNALAVDCSDDKGLLDGVVLVSI